MFSLLIFFIVFIKFIFSQKFTSARSSSVSLLTKPWGNSCQLEMMVDKSKGDDDNDRDQLIMVEMMMMMIQEGTFAIALVFPCSTAISKDSAAFLA